MLRLSWAVTICWQAALDNCIRTEEGACGIQWKESSTSSPDPFQMTSAPIPNAAAGHPSKRKSSINNAPMTFFYPAAFAASFIYIPNLSSDGIQALQAPATCVDVPLVLIVQLFHWHLHVGLQKIFRSFVFIF